MPNEALPSRRRFRPRLVPTVAMLALVAATVSLGNWQHRRAEYKRSLAAQYSAALLADPIVLGTATGLDPSLRYRPVRVRGTFVASGQMLLDNRIHHGRVGYEVLTPLRLESGSAAVLVNRGWVPMGTDRASLPVPAVPAGEQVVEGRLEFPSPSASGRGEPAGLVWQRIDPEAMASATGLRLLPAVVEQAPSPAVADGLERDWPAPDFGIDRHLGYMLQWYSLAALAIVLWLALNWRREA